MLLEPIFYSETQNEYLEKYFIHCWSGSCYIYDQGQEEKRNCHSHNVSLENVTVEIQDVQNMS